MSENENGLILTIGVAAVVSIGIGYFFKRDTDRITGSLTDRIIPLEQELINVKQVVCQPKRLEEMTQRLNDQMIQANKLLESTSNLSD